jgi:hypothetical protein
VEGIAISKINFGTAGVIQWIHGGGTVSLLPNFTSLEFNQSGDTVDTTSGAATWDTHITSRRNWEASLELFWDSAATTGTGGTADLIKLTPNELGLLAIGPQGTATGSPKLGGSVTVTKNDTAMPFADPLTVKLSFKGNGQPYWNHGSAWA